MTQAASHDKYMEDLMRSKILMLCIEQRKLQCVDNTSDGIDHTSGNQPDKCCGGKSLDQRNHGKDTEPSHGNVYDGRYLAKVSVCVILVGVASMMLYHLFVIRLIIAGIVIVVTLYYAVKVMAVIGHKNKSMV